MSKNDIPLVLNVSEMSYPHIHFITKTFFKNIVDTSGMASYYRGSS
jgi:hypothetical protein